MPTGRRVFNSSVGMKLLIGVTGFALFVYLVIHIIGNLMVFFGPAAFNKYAYTLEGNPLIPIIEIGLLLIFLVHVYKTVRMFLENQTARPIRYAKKKYAGRTSRKTLASSTMIVSGLWLLVFIVIHVKAFRYGMEYDWPAGCAIMSRGCTSSVKRTSPITAPTGWARAPSCRGSLTGISSCRTPSATTWRVVRCGR